MDASDINIGHDDFNVESESDENAELIMCESWSKIFDTDIKTRDLQDNVLWSCNMWGPF